MGYLHIDNLYKNQDILQFKECYAMEKIHGTSAHIAFGIGENFPSKNPLKFFSGGSKHETFIKIFDSKKLLEKFKDLGVDKIVVYGEAYGGKCQGMKDTYGSELKFVAFDVKIGNSWLSVPQAEQIVESLGLEFIYYVKIHTRLGFIDGERDADSMQAIRNGIGIGKKREGIVLRPLIEVIKNNGERIIIKHKRDDFRETKTKRKIIDKDKLKVLTEAKTIAEEWVTLMRLNHVLDKIENPSIKKMRDIIISMVEDVKRESFGEVVWSKEVQKYIGRKTAQLTKQYFQNKLKEN